MDESIVTAGIIVIGNEILSGRTQDTNLQFIAKHLVGMGVSIREAQVVPDVKSVIVTTVNDYRSRFDYVLTTGGIGPTHDDITTDCIAAAFNVDVVVNAEIEKRIKSRPAPDAVLASRLRMARVPEGATLIDNPTGGPQGFSLDNVYVMAGIPLVMQAMLSTIVFSGGAIVHSRSVTAHLGESEIADDLSAIQEAYPRIDLGSYPFYRNDIYGTSLVMRGTDESALDAALEELCTVITKRGQNPLDIERD